jgi:tetratricopeptide (TPR) repeat protein
LRNDSDANGRILEFIERSFKADRNNPLALKLIAEHYFESRKFDFVTVLCEHALSILEGYSRPEHIVRENPNYRKDIDVLKSDFYFILGKMRHVLGQTSEAQELYTKAVKLNEKNMAAQLNLGKVFFLQGRYPQAESCLESVLKYPKHKDSFETLRLLA